MEQLDNYIWYSGLFISVIFFATLVVKGFRHWYQLQRAFLQSGMKWPLHSQKELRNTALKNLLDGYKMMWFDLAQVARILFMLRTDNPLILKPIRGIRRIFIVFLLFPFILAFALVAVYAFFAV